MLRMFTAIACIAFTLSSLHLAFAEEKKVIEPVDEWVGSVEELPAGSGETMTITNKNELEKWWKAASPKAKLPNIDFKKDFVVILYGRGSSIDVVATLKNGDLSVVGEPSKDSPPGVRYSVVQFHREGIQRVNKVRLK